MAIEALVNHDGVYRVVLEEYPEGVYLLVYDSPEDRNDSPREDHLQDNWDIAKRAALDDYGISEEMWRRIPDTNFNGPHQYTALEAIVGREGLHRVLLQVHAEGVYLVAYDTPDANNPVIAKFGGDWEAAKRAAARDYGISETMWKSIPDPRCCG